MNSVWDNLIHKITRNLNSIKEKGWKGISWVSRSVADLSEACAILLSQEDSHGYTGLHDQKPLVSYK